MAGPDHLGSRRRAGVARSALPSQGAARTLKRRLVGKMLPSFEFSSFPGSVADLAIMREPSSLIVCVAPGPYGSGGVEADTARARGWKSYHPALVALRYRLVWASACPLGVLQEWAEREGLGFTLLSDTEFELARALGLPTAEIAGTRVYEPLTFITQEREVTRAFFPVDPLQDALVVADRLRRVHANCL
jgi:peroxiredoxin